MGTLCSLVAAVCHHCVSVAKWNDGFPVECIFTSGTTGVSAVDRTQYSISAWLQSHLLPAILITTAVVPVRVCIVGTLTRWLLSGALLFWVYASIAWSVSRYCWSSVHHQEVYSKSWSMVCVYCTCPVTSRHMVKSNNCFTPLDLHEWVEMVRDQPYFCWSLELL